VSFRKPEATVPADSATLVEEGPPALFEGEAAAGGSADGSVDGSVHSQAAPAAGPGEDWPVRVLLIEDDVVDRFAFDRFVRKEGLRYDHVMAASYQEAMGLLESRGFDVVLTDYHLGDGSALDILELELDVPVVVITGAGDEEIAVQAMRAGAFDYLTKDTERRYLKMVQVTIENARRHHLAARRERQLLQALKESEERYALAAAGANDGLWDWDLRSGHLYMSARWKSILGYGEGELEPNISAWLCLVHPEDLALLEAQLDAHIAGQTPHFENEHRIRSSEGDWRWVQVRGLAVRQPGGRAYRMAGSQRDITDRRRAEEQLAHSALHDALTGLPNRVLFLDRLESALSRFQRRAEAAFAVISFDLDRFKVVNDSLGHLAGDQLLRSLATRLSTHCLRVGDTFARLGGDEFAILLDEVVELEKVEEVADHLQFALGAPFEVAGHEVFCGVSLGIAMSAPSYRKAEDLLRDADSAMYQAKAQGRKRKVVFRPDMHQSALARLQIESELRRAIERRELRVHYQPLVDLHKGLVRGFEALVRWQHPERGLLYPGEFLSIAQEAGLTPAMGALVLEEACRTLKAWQDEAPPEAARHLSVSVNLDGQQLSSLDLRDQVDAALRSSGLEPKYLRLEITEDLLVRQPKRAKEILEGLREQGVKIYLDDFGIGYSSLSQIEEFPIDVLKIDRNFVQRMTQDDSAFEIVRTILMLAGNLGLETLAEGIERESHLESLLRLGCRHGQGYLFSKPLPPEEARLWALSAADRIVPGFGG
jgi:diguanylate cyclase (GGDEF)-like protein/PAS domain S-box-containing protein